MKPKHPLTQFAAKHQSLLLVLIGLAVLIGAFVAATKSNMANIQSTLSNTTSYVKEQCNHYARIQLASETKSLMRMTESCKQIVHQLAESNTAADETALQRCAENTYVSGVLLLDPQGEILAQYHAEGQAPADLADYLASPALRDTVSYPEKRYAARFYCEDGSEVDLTAARRQDQAGLVVAYYHTTVEYLDSFSLSITSMLSGYDQENNGIIVVSNGSDIIASNDPTLIGSSTDDLEILRKIKAEGVSDKLVQAKQGDGTFAHYLGLMERGRDCYVYAFLPEQTVFRSTPRTMVYALVAYLILLAVTNAVRWRTAQVYHDEQIQAQIKHANNLREKNEQLIRAVDQADRANAAKTSFLSHMSHDIRTPLNGILGLLQIDAAHPDDTALLSANREKMRVAADHLLALINDILEMSQLESGEIVLAREPLDLETLTSDVFTIIEQRAAESGITMVRDERSDPMELPYVYGSPLHLRQILLNIYTNCIKYNRVGGRITTRFQCLGRKNQVVTYRWTISDTGIGMSEAFLEHIFDPFSQENVADRKGTGLGMTIVQNLVEKMHGTIEISSTEGVGSTFVITLPFAVSEQAVAAPPPPDPTASLRGLHLLLADDNELNAEIVRISLSDEGATLTIVSDGQEAVEAFRTHPAGTFDAILMDIMMPVMDGLTATKTIRAMDRPDAKTIPILAMTANAFEEDAQRCFAAGMNAHLPKPLQIDKVKQTILVQTKHDPCADPTPSQKEDVPNDR